MPEVSIGLPVYNGERYLAKAIESILAQDYEDLELVISDNASTDATADICEDYARIDRRVKYHCFPENLGAARNYNEVFRQSSGRYFKWSAHDDVIKPAYLSTCLQGFQEDSSIVYPGAEFIDENDEVIRTDTDRQATSSDSPFVRSFEVLQTMSMAASVFGVFNRSKLERTGLIGAFISSDYVLLLQAAMLGKIVRLDTEPLFQRRLHSKMSRLANTGHNDVLSWFDPKARSRLSERKRLYLEYSKAAFGIEGMPIPNKFMLSATAVAAFSFKAARVNTGRMRRNVATALRRQRSS
ncbi:MAG: glycosyltransferase [Sulfitobacter sp.]